MKTANPIPFSMVNQETKGSHKFVLFRQETSQFAIEITSVREVLILETQPITSVPNTLPFLLGLMNLRGEILAIADFSRFIGGEGVARHQEDSRILVLEVPNPSDVKLPPIRMGLAVSFVEGVLSLNPDDIVSAEEVDEALAPFLRGLYDYQGRLLMIVDVEAIAQSERW
ncbi:MAG: chemotaxis protein CheW [Chroococcales cyanobacterium]